jgi:hypothetical protein
MLTTHAQALFNIVMPVMMQDQQSAKRALFSDPSCLPEGTQRKVSDAPSTIN